MIPITYFPIKIFTMSYIPRANSSKEDTLSCLHLSETFSTDPQTILPDSCTDAIYCDFGKKKNMYAIFRQEVIAPHLKNILCNVYKVPLKKGHYSFFL